MEIPVIQVKKHNGKTVLQPATQLVSINTRYNDMRESLAEIFVNKIKNNEERKVDQSVLAIEIGINE